MTGRNTNNQLVTESDEEHKTIKLMRSMLEEQFDVYERSMKELKTLAIAEKEQRRQETETSNAIMRKLVTEMEELKQLQRDTVALATNYKIVYTMAFVALFVPVGVFFSDFRQALGITAPLAYAFSFIFYVISFSLFAYLYGFIANRSKKT